MLRITAWTAPLGGWLYLRIADLTSTDIPSNLVVVLLAWVFISLVAQVIIEAIRTPGRRTALLSLALGLLLWACGSAVLNASASPQNVTFPAPGEWLFLTSYVGFSAFLVFDRSAASPVASGGWLDALIVVGGTACVVLALLLAPFSAEAGSDGVALLVALLYPLLDFTLLLLIIGQVTLRQRPLTIRTVTLGAAFVVLGCADASLVASVHRGSYDFGEQLDLAWGLGFLLLTDASCQRRRRPAQGQGQAPTRRPGTLPVVAAAAVAMLTLVLEQSSRLRLVVDIPAVLTLLAVGLRLVLALRQSHQLNEALRLSRTDDLTGLPNRRALNAGLQHSAARPGPLALMVLDLDGFKEINDTLGHTAGDMVLAAIAARIDATASHASLTARLGGDEFAILLPEADERRLIEQAVRLREAVRRPVHVDGIEVCLDISTGIAIRGADSSRVADLLRQADVAMYQAKTGQARTLFYDAGRDDFSRERLRIAEGLRRGIDTGELIAWYQPKVSAQTQEPSGVEALVRWAHATNGLLTPGVFLPTARRAGLMPALTRAVFEQVVTDLVEWRRRGFEIPVAVNVGPAELLTPAVMSDVFGMVRSAELNAGSLVIEVTEDSFLAEPDRAREAIEAIRDEGIEVSIDDYGTGFSCLSYLRDLPVQEIKIDVTFVRGLLDNARNEMIVKTTSTLALGLGLRTVAEGVEDAATAQRLREIGVDVLQGYHFAKPLPPAEIPTWFASHSREPVTMT